MVKQKQEKPTIGCRVNPSDLAEIDSIIAETGQSRSDWLLQLVRQALGQDAATVQGMDARIAALERKLSRLAN